MQALADQRMLYARAQQYMGVEQRAGTEDHQVGRSMFAAPGAGKVHTGGGSGNRVDRVDFRVELQLNAGIIVNGGQSVLNRELGVDRTEFTHASGTTDPTLARSHAGSRCPAVDSAVRETLL